MPVNIKVTEMKYKNGQGEYVGINGYSERSTAEQIAEIEQKGAEVYASIPENYSALNTAVKNLSEIAKENASFFIYNSPYEIFRLLLFPENL